MSNDARTPVTPQLVFGAFLLIVGVVLLLDRVLIFEFLTSGLLRLWPAGLVAIGVALLLQSKDDSGRWWGYVWITSGTWMLLRSLGLIRVGFWQLFWPLCLIGVGVRIVTQTLRSGKTAEGRTPGVSHLVAIMGESTRVIDDKPFKRGSMTAVMGGGVLDLRMATIEPGEEAVVDVFAFMGGFEIAVPAHWAVVSRAAHIMGGLEDKRLPPMGGVSTGTDVPVPPRLVVNGVVIMGGLTIRN